MQLTSILLAALGLSVAGGSAYLAHGYMQASTVAPPVVETEPDLVEVMIAARDIGFGDAIEDGMVVAQAWPVGALPSGAFTRLSDILPADGGEPRRSRTSIARGQPILADHVSAFGERVTIVQTLSENGRAMAINVNAETAAGGFVRPGDYVDVVLTQGTGEDMSAATILQNIRVIAVDQDADQQSDAPQVSRTVTVEVTADQGQSLALAQRAGRLSLMLRNYGSADESLPRAIRLSDMLVGEEEEIVVVEEPAPPPAPPRTVTVRRGVEVETVAMEGGT
jgi:pilus assembly protein CpaB